MLVCSLFYAYLANDVLLGRYLRLQQHCKAIDDEMAKAKPRDRVLLPLMTGFAGCLLDKMLLVLKKLLRHTQPLSCQQL